MDAEVSRVPGEGELMGFDEQVEEIYLEGGWWAVEYEVRSFPVNQRMLVGLRATFIKQRLIWEGKLDRESLEDPCGVCCAVPQIMDTDGPDCDFCPLLVACGERFSRSPETNMMRAFEAYMAEHKKFV